MALRRSGSRWTIASTRASPTPLRRASNAAAVSDASPPSGRCRWAAVATTGSSTDAEMVRSSGGGAMMALDQEEAEREWAGTWYFAQLADTQFGMFHRDASWAEEKRLAQLAVAQINALRPQPKFVVVCVWPSRTNVVKLSMCYTRPYMLH
eukprot:SAG31_NODE_18999_length_615_cov_0.965116_1_plen_151_part_00